MGPQQSEEPKQHEGRSTEGDETSENGSLWDAGNGHVMEIFKDGDLFVAAKTGQLEDFRRILDRVSGDTLSRWSPAGNTYLHVAAKHGHEDIVTFIAAKQPSLLLSRNVINGETALHLAAKAGNASMVRAFVLIRRNQRAPIEDLLRGGELQGKHGAT